MSHRAREGVRERAKERREGRKTKNERGAKWKVGSGEEEEAGVGCVDICLCVRECSVRASMCWRNRPVSNVDVDVDVDEDDDTRVGVV